MKEYLKRLKGVLYRTFIQPADIGEVTRASAFLGTLAVTLYLFATGHAVPDLLTGFLGLFAGYYFRGVQMGVGSSGAMYQHEGREN